MNKITFKEYLIEESNDNQIFKLLFDTKLPVVKGWEPPRTGRICLMQIYLNGLIYNDKENCLIGLFKDLWTYVKTEMLHLPSDVINKLNLEQINTLGKLRNKMSLAHDYIADLQSAPHLDRTLSHHASDGNEYLPFGVSKAGRNKNSPQIYNYNFIHLKNVKIEDLPFVKIEKHVVYNPWDDEHANGTSIKRGEPGYDEYEKRTAAAWYAHTEIFHILPASENVEGKDYLKDNPDYEYLDDHFTQVTTPDQLKRGTLQFHLGAHAAGDLLIYVNNGYVRLMIPGNDRLRKLHSPTGDTPQERLNAALAFAVKYVKKNV